RHLSMKSEDWTGVNRRHFVIEERGLNLCEQTSSIDEERGLN
ncbi:hypothetical protein Tco_1222736, partial [Tanacetum coccineum]